MGLGKKEDHYCQPDDGLVIPHIKVNEQDHQAGTDPVIPADDIVFIEDKIAENDQQFLRKSKVASQQEGDGNATDQDMQELHRKRIGGKAGDQEQHYIPEQGMSLDAAGMEHFRKGMAITGNQEMLGLVKPDLVIENACKTQPEKK